MFRAFRRPRRRDARLRISAAFPWFRAGRLREALIPPAQALSDFDCLTVSAEEARVLVSGNTLPATEDLEPGQPVGTLLPDGRLLGVCEVMERDGTPVIQPRRMLIVPEDL